MKAPCLYHHRVREGFFKLDQIPSEVVANVFKYIPTLDIGRMMVVCRGFNDILSTNPSLWRIIDLDKETPNNSALRVIEVFATHSRDTLVAIRTPESMDRRMEALILLLERSKATLRRLDLEFFIDKVSRKGMPILSSFRSFPNIERLNLTSKDLPEAEGQISGKLTMFAYDCFLVNDTWPSEELDRFSSVRYLHIETYSLVEEKGRFRPPLQACSSNLLHLSIGPLIVTDPLQFDLPNLSSLVFLDLDFVPRYLFSRPLPSLKHLEGHPMALDGLGCGQLQSVCFRIESVSMDGQIDERFNSVEKMIKLTRDSSSTLKSIKLKAGQEGEFGLDPFLRTLKVDYLSPLCPLLTDLYIAEDQEFNLKLLAEVMVSRNFAAKGWKFKGENEEDDDGQVEIVGRKCSRLALHLDASEIKEFKIAEKKVLSRIPKWMSKQAGRTDVREWIGK